LTRRLAGELSQLQARAPHRALPRRVFCWAPTLRAGQVGRFTALNQLEGKDIYTRDSREMFAVMFAIQIKPLCLRH
jgi:hypothetical protein